MDITDDLWHLSEQVRSFWMSFPVQLEFCRWRGMTRAAPPWERKNGRQMGQAREISQTRLSLSLQIFRPNLNEKIKPHFFWLFLLIPHVLPPINRIKRLVVRLRSGLLERLKMSLSWMANQGVGAWSLRKMASQNEILRWLPMVVSWRCPSCVLQLWREP